VGAASRHVEGIVYNPAISGPTERSSFFLSVVTKLSSCCAAHPAAQGQRLFQDVACHWSQQMGKRQKQEGRSTFLSHVLVLSHSEVIIQVDSDSLSSVGTRSTQSMTSTATATFRGLQAQAQLLLEALTAHIGNVSGLCPVTRGWRSRAGIRRLSPCTHR
jgi:hypothetical protein